MASRHVFAFLPYLRTSGPVRYRGITLRSSTDSESIPQEAQPNFAILKQLFFLRDNYRINDTSYALKPLTGADEDNTFFSTLLELQTILAYFYSGPRAEFNDVFLSPEHASLYWFVPKDITRHLIQEEWKVEQLPGSEYPPPDDRDELPGYETYLNGQLVNWVTNGSRIYPPVPRIVLNRSQDLSDDLQRIGMSTRHAPLLEHFGSPRRVPTTRDKQLLTALSWYNRANSEYADEQSSIAHLAIAFEALLNLPAGQGVTQRFIEAVTLLLGRIPRLESWASQFYNARSDIVHKGATERLHFLAADDHRKANATLEYKPLIAYGRQIFQLCVATIISGTQLAESAKLTSQLATNAERFERICKTLNQQGRSGELIAATADDVDDIHQYRYQNESGLTIKKMIGAAKLIVRHYLATDPQEKADLIVAMKELTTAALEFDQLDAIRRISDAFGEAQGPDASRALVQSLINSVWHYSFMHYFAVQQRQEPRQTDDKNP